MKKSKFYIILILFLTGCVTNPYSDYYNPYDRKTSSQIKKSEDSGLADPIIISIPDLENKDDVENIFQKYVRKGYYLIGESNFNGPEVNKDDLLNHARSIGADLVLTNVKYLTTVSGTVPLTLPTTNTTYHSGSITGDVFGSYSGTTTSYGTNTTYLPYQTNRYQYRAAFMVKIKTSLGIFFNDIDQSTRKLIGENKGVRIIVVVDNSPAFYADVLEGDIITSINDNIVRTPEQLQMLLDKTLVDKKPIDFEIFRNNQYLNITIIPNS